MRLSCDQTGGHFAPTPHLRAVSTVEQCLNGQLAELQAAGCAKVYSEKASGARGDCTELRKVIDRLQPGDVLVVTRLDRLRALHA
jgi:DNA invertase Pin-like site-specific DNA recombinase